MKTKNFIYKVTNRIKSFLSEMNAKQKLLVSIAFVLLLIFFIKILFENDSDRIGQTIDYSHISAENLYTFSSIIEDKNIYVTVKSITDDFISICLGNTRDENGEMIMTNYIYNSMLISEYKNNISESEFNKKVEEMKNKVKTLNDNNYSLIPDNITEVEENYYLAKYEFNVNEQIISFYIGIMLDELNSQYYIWYLE